MTSGYPLGPTFDAPDWRPESRRGPRRDRLMATHTDTQDWPARWASESFLYLTTVGRRTGRQHRIEIWFAEHDGRLYLLAGGRDHADWVRNLLASPRVTVELGGESRAGLARPLEPDTAEDRLARELVVAKYSPAEDNLDVWGRTSLPVAIEFPAAAS